MKKKAAQLYIAFHLSMDCLYLNICSSMYTSSYSTIFFSVFWMKAKFNMLDSDMQEAITSFDRVRADLISCHLL